MDSDRGKCRCCGALEPYRSLRLLDAPYRQYVNSAPEMYSELFAETFGFSISYISGQMREICETCVQRLRGAHAFRHQVLMQEQSLVQASYGADRSTKSPEHDLSNLEFIKIELMSDSRSEEDVEFIDEHKALDSDNNEDKVIEKIKGEISEKNDLLEDLKDPEDLLEVKKYIIETTKNVTKLVIPISSQSADKVEPKKKKRTRSKRPIPPNVIATLEAWYDKHKDAPYVTSEDFGQLNVDTGMSVRRLRLWFRKEKPAMCFRAPKRRTRKPRDSNSKLQVVEKFFRQRLPVRATEILKDWLNTHPDQPYPTELEKGKLCILTNLTMTQVRNWFINARRRLLPKMGKYDATISAMRAKNKKTSSEHSDNKENEQSR